MRMRIIKRPKLVTILIVLGLLLGVGCGLQITRPPAGGNVTSPVMAEIKFRSDLCGRPFRASLDGIDVTSQFFPPAASNGQTQAIFHGISPGSHALTGSADMDLGFLRRDCRESTHTVNFNVNVDTPYMAECRARGVPIPPDWAESGTAWVLQGKLGEGKNLLEPEKDAFVWTYTDPSVRGACIALPRGNGDPGTLAGIICQSATGHACFWDNKLSSDPAQRPFGWRGQRLVIRDLADGSNLDENCTNCHRGNNVFLISPDDPTWRKVLKGPLNGGPSNNLFTTQITVSHYIPIGQDGWINPLVSEGCASKCHLQPPDRVEGLRRRSSQLMPPACATLPGGCYGTP